MKLQELQTLHELIKELGQAHAKTKQQMLALKDKPMVEASAFNGLQSELEKYKQAHSTLKTKLDDASFELSKLQKQHDEKCRQCDELSENVASLTAENDELLAKNEISSQRAQTILERLAALDNAN